jgi:hypothetical protein
MHGRYMEDNNSKPENTKLAYDRKTREFIEFCEAIFPVNNDDNLGQWK